MATEPVATITAAAGVTEEDLRVIFSGPSIFATRAFITLIGQNARITFVDQGPQGAVFRSSATITIADLLSLRDVINSLEIRVVEQTDDA